jgi:prevent-host-death family protein
MSRKPWLCDFRFDPNMGLSLQFKKEVVIMTVQVNIYEAKSKFSKLVNQAIAGEEIIIAKSDKPVAKLVPIETALKDRIPGSAKGKITITEDFDAPLPDDVLESFYQ